MARCEPPCTVGQLKALLMTRLNISPRKGLSLTWWGAVLEPDERTLQLHNPPSFNVVGEVDELQNAFDKEPILLEMGVKLLAGDEPLGVKAAFCALLDDIVQFLTEAAERGCCAVRHLRHV